MVRLVVLISIAAALVLTLVIILAVFCVIVSSFCFLDTRATMMSFEHELYAPYGIVSTGSRLLLQAHTDVMFIFCHEICPIP